MKEKKAAGGEAGGHVIPLPARKRGIELNIWLSDLRINLRAIDDSGSERGAHLKGADGALTLILNIVSNPNVYFLGRTIARSDGGFVFTRLAAGSTNPIRRAGPAVTLRVEDFARPQATAPRSRLAGSRLPIRFSSRARGCTAALAAATR